MSGPRITVIIPTRARCDVLEKTLKTVTNQDYDNLEVIVSDNLSGDATEDIVRGTDDKRVRYINTGKRVSMSDNWEFALSHCTDGWVTVLGDDDGLLAGSLQKVSELIRSANVQAIRSSVCFYLWPSLTGKEFGYLEVPLKSGWELRDSKSWLNKVMNGHAKYPDLPMLYNGGFVDLGVLKEIKRKTGAFYRSCIPDVYSAISISSVVGNYIYSHEPLAINGGSKHSTGTSQFAIHDKSELTPAQIFRKEGNIPFHKDVPLYGDGNYPASIQAIVYESYLQSASLRSNVEQDFHQQQLELILATSHKHSIAIETWGKLFAATHGLHFDSIQQRAWKLERLLKIRSIPGRISSRFNTYDVGSSDLPIVDVFEASIAAEAIMNNSPNVFERARRLASRALSKLN